MSKLWVGIIAGVGGFALGVVITRQIALDKVTGKVNMFLGNIGLGGGVVQSVSDQLITSGS